MGIFIGYYEPEADESTGQMLHLPSLQPSQQNRQDKAGGPIVTDGAVIPQRGGAPGTEIHCILFTDFLPASTSHNVGKYISLVHPVLNELYMRWRVMK